MSSYLIFSGLKKAIEEQGGKGQVGLFVVMDKHILGRGVFGVFTSNEKAEKYLDETKQEVGCLCVVHEMDVIGICHSPEEVFAGYIYDSFYATHVLDGIYGDPLVAREGAGPGGRVVRLVVDSPKELEVL